MAYQAIYYDFLEKTYHLRDSVEGWQCFKYQPTYYKIDPDGEFPTLDGLRANPTTKYSKFDLELYEKDINKELVVLRDLYYETDDIPESQNLAYLDIEIEMGGTLTPAYIKSAPMEITAIALIDVNLKQKTCFIVDKTKKIELIDKGDKHIIPCNNEEDLIHKFLNKWEEIDPTIVATYNGNYFDIPYLYYRLCKIVGKKTTSRLSPIRKINEMEWSPDSPIKIGGVSSLDYMLLIKKYIAKEEPSYKLGDIGEKYVKLGKIEYQGNLDQLFKDDINKFIEYNIRDVEIIEALEAKLQFIKLTILISHLCHTPYESIYWNTVLNEGAILTYLKRKGIVAPNKPTTINESLKPKPGVKEESYAGGYLLDPVPGLYEDLVDLDYTSLYPSIIKTLNLGIETLVGRIKTVNNFQQDLSLEKLQLRDPNEILIVEKLNTKNYRLKSGEISVGKLIKIIKDNKYTISASGAFFTTDKKSIACEVLEDWFEKRDYYKGLRKKAGKSEDWENYKLYDLYQQAFKILQNALYGTYAISSWRFSDGHKICSAAITNSGQRLTKESIDFVNEIINNELKTDKSYIVGSDTDSLYISVGDILKKRYPDFNQENKQKYILEIASEIQDKANLNLTPISKNLFNVSKKHYFELKQEVIIARAYWSGKRRYAMYITNKEGVDIEELDMKGLDLMKSNINKEFKIFGTDIIKRLLFGSKKQEIDKLILDYKNVVKLMPLKEIAKPTGVKKLNEYIKRSPRDGKMFSDFKLKCPINTRAACYYNDLIKFKKLDKTYSNFIPGDKMYYVYLKNNPYKIEVLGFNGYKDPPEIITFIEQFVDKEKMFDNVLLNKLQKVYDDIGFGHLNLNPHTNTFFSYS